MARTGRWQFENVYENTFGDIAGIERKHSVVDVLLDTFSAMARGDSAAGGSSIQTSFDAMGLGVIGDILNDHAPLAVGIHSSAWPHVKDIARADVSVTTHPISPRKWIAVVKRIVEMFLFQRSDTIDQVISRLECNVGVFL